MNIVEIKELGESGTEVFAHMTGRVADAQRLREERGVFVAESPKVIMRALEAGYEPVAVMCERPHVEGDAAGLLALCPEGMPVYTGEREVLGQLTGYELTRGVLCAMRRRTMPRIGEVCGLGCRRVLVMDGVVEATNVGAMMRTAAALGMGAVVLTHSCDPLNRRAARVSMGGVFQVAWTVAEESPYAELRRMGFVIAAMALRPGRSVRVDDPALHRQPRVAIVMGNEGYGLPDQVIEEADYTVMIPMAEGVDSLNVGAAAAIAMWAI